MSSKNSGLLNRLKSKSIDKLFSNTNQITTSYQYIENFENVSEEDCIKLDNINREIYKKNMELYELINKKIEHKNAMFKIETPPQPPSEPNNHEKYISYKMRNVSYNVKYQSLAICYLISKGYRLNFDKIESKLEFDFEPYEAIELFQKLENISIENAFKNKNYEYYTTNFIPNSLSSNRNSILQNYQNYQNYPTLSSSAPTNTLYPVISAPPHSPHPPHSPNLPNINYTYDNKEISSNISGPPASHYYIKK
jgi:hypothetical protein